jgi:hypothetical protein
MLDVDFASRPLWVAAFSCMLNNCKISPSVFTFWLSCLSFSNCYSLLGSEREGGYFFTHCSFIGVLQRVS